MSDTPEQAAASPRWEVPDVDPDPATGWHTWPLRIDGEQKATVVEEESGYRAVAGSWDSGRRQFRQDAIDAALHHLVGTPPGEVGGVNHPDGETDHRYVVGQEWCGYPTRRWVARFCGSWLGQAETEPEAWKVAQEHARARRQGWASEG